MTMKNNTKYGVLLIGVLSLLTLAVLGLPNVSHDNTKLASNADKSIESLDKPINIPVSGLLQKYTYTDLNNLSDTVVIGTVKEILPPKWNAVDGKRPNKSRSEIILENVIYTDIIINVDKYVKNPLSSNELTVRATGGTVGNDSMSADHEPSFKTGEKVLLYLIEDTDPQIKNIGPKHFTVTGYKQGKFTLTDDGQAIGSDETISQEELLSTIKE
ncbi:hypothetical protein MSHOH_1610 [Methanosarcina horonobensis HB-1 = JCM 15518]|uniref:Uncharacterized protein n=1 Tax=Methanosarcina horonobensis HB-1 = JCM 15518 TaxID=1434110 RepID=A0A0E3SF49_9EURY|nr:hypothetical protein [Methanosarcina horonobensis]AKB78093.1 hypothetical protein MSHOH_1610 [Methanosarcina horonobensis HB-1 = JCM 15518]